MGAFRSQIQKLTAEFEKQAEEMEKRQKIINSATAATAEEPATVAGLRQELTALREQLSRSIAVSNTPHLRGDPTFNMTTGKGLENGSTTLNHLNGISKRRPRRNSVPDAETGEVDNMEADYDPRSVSVMYTDSGIGSFRAPGSTAYIADSSDEEPAEAIMELLEGDEALDSDVLNGLIRHLRIPNPSLNSPPFAKEVLFPAHLISLVTNEMWKYGLLPESERFLANVMQTIQQHAMVSRRQAWLCYFQT